MSSVYCELHVFKKITLNRFIYWTLVRMILPQEGANTYILFVFTAMEMRNTLTASRLFVVKVNWVVMTPWLNTVTVWISSSMRMDPSSASTVGAVQFHMATRVQVLPPLSQRFHRLPSPRPCQVSWIGQARLKHTHIHTEKCRHTQQWREEFYSHSLCLHTLNTCIHTHNVRPMETRGWVLCSKNPIGPSDGEKEAENVTSFLLWM